MKNLKWFILVLPWIGFLVFWFKPYSVYHVCERIYPSSELKADTLLVSWSDAVNEKLDSVRNSYNSKRYLYPKPPYVEVFVDSGAATSLMRFKGDYISHLDEKLWSFRLKMKFHDRWKGMNKVNFHQPSQRNDINEYVYQKHFASKDHLTLGYDFVLVGKNQSPVELYACEEGLGDEYLKRRNLKGVILRFDESNLFDWMIKKEPDSFPSAVMDNFFRTAKIVVQGENTDLKVLKAEAKSKLDAWRKGDLKTSDIFKVEKTAEFLALTDLWGAYHSVACNNMRLFYDEVEKKFELIASDGNSRLNTRMMIESPYLSYQMFFKDEEFTGEYKKFVKKYKSGRPIASFLLKNIEETMMRKGLIETFYPAADNNLAYLVGNFSVAKEWEKQNK